MGAEGPGQAGPDPPSFSAEHAGDVGQHGLWKTGSVHGTASR